MSWWATFWTFVCGLFGGWVVSLLAYDRARKHSAVATDALRAEIEQLKKRMAHLERVKAFRE